jgi:hypothetical protein
MEAALKTSQEAAMCSSKKLARNESLCISSQVCNIFDEVSSQPGPDMSITSDVTRSAKKADKKERQQAAKYELEKLPLIPSVPDKQETPQAAWPCT